MKFFFDYSALYYIFYIVLSSFTLCCVSNRVETMHDLLSCSGWLEMAKVNQRIEIIDRRHPHQPERKWTVFRLLATPVIDGNVTDKIQVAHQFLSCSYARVVIDLCDYEQGIGPQCRSKDTATESFDCLEDYLQVILYKRQVVSRMTGALSTLQELAPSQTHFEKVVFKILGELEKYYQQNAVVRPPDEDYQATRRIADAESKAIEQHARLMIRRLFAFYNRYCSSISYWIRDSGLSKPAEDIREFVNIPKKNSIFVVRNIKEKITYIVKKFTESHDATSGFEYDPESKTTRIMRFDPIIDERVEKMDLLLKNKVLSRAFLTKLVIKEHGNPYWITIDELLSPIDIPYGNIVVTKENLNAKLKKSHQFLSCMNAWIIVECCHKVTDMWSICKKSEDSVCLESFLRILEEVDPLVLRMVNSLLYFYQLSPDTVYNKYVFDLLKRFKNFYDDITARTDRDVMSLSPEIEKGILENLQNLTEFFQQFCYSQFNIHSYFFSESTIDVKGEFFKERMLQLSHYYGVFK